MKKGTGALRQTNGEDLQYCCLGVACEVFLTGQWDDEAADPDFVVADGTVVGAYGAIHKGPRSVGSILNLDDDTRFVLADKNDEGKSFAEIADYIETLPLEDAEVIA